MRTVTSCTVEPCAPCKNSATAPGLPLWISKSIPRTIWFMLTFSFARFVTLRTFFGLVGSLKPGARSRRTIVGRRGRLAVLPSTRAALAGEVFPALLPQCTDRLIPVRHGAVWGLAELLLGLHAAAVTGAATAVAAKLTAVLGPSLLAEAVDVVRRVQEAQLYRGRGGEMMREAVCRLISCIATAGIPLEPPAIAMLQAALDENICYSKLEIVEAAVAALKTFCPVYYPAVGGGGLRDAAKEQRVHRALYEPAACRRLGRVVAVLLELV